MLVKILPNVIHKHQCPTKITQLFNSVSEILMYLTWLPDEILQPLSVRYTEF